MAEPAFGVHQPETMSPGVIQGQDDAAEEVHAFMGSLRPFWGRALLYIVLLFVIVAITWAWWGKVDVVASAPFRLVPLGQVKTMQAQRGGEIELIGVKEGEHIEKGQVLFKLKSWETWGELREWEQAKMAFQKAEYDLKDGVATKGEVKSRDDRSIGTTSFCFTAVYGGTPECAGRLSKRCG